MIKSILAVIAAAVCAGAIVEFIAEPPPAVAAGTAPAAQSRGTSIADSEKPAVVAVVRIAESQKAICAQGWPYYEPTCLRDGRQSDGKARAVRLITADGSVAGRTWQAPR